MAQPDDSTPFDVLWSSFNGWPDSRKSVVFTQVMHGIRNLPMPSVANVLSGMTAKLKEYVWTQWAKSTDLSGASLSDIMDAQSTEPPSAIYAIVQSWLRQVDLSKYDLGQVRKCASLLRGDDVGNLWQRWLSQADLRHVNLVSFAKAISDLSPEIQLTCLNGFARHCPNLGTYGWEEKKRVKGMLSDYAVRNATFLSGSGLSPAKYKVGDAVKIVGQSYSTRVEAVFQFNGVWKYRLKDEMRYFDESELVGI